MSRRKKKDRYRRRLWAPVPRGLKAGAGPPGSMDALADLRWTKAEEQAAYPARSSLDLLQGKSSPGACHKCGHLWHDEERCGAPPQRSPQLLRQLSQRPSHVQLPIASE